MIKLDEIRCKSCGICVEFCPWKCLAITNKINDKGHKIVGLSDESKCTACGICYLVCPDAAISVYKP